MAKDNEAKFVLTADDRTKAAFDSVERNMNKLKGMAGVVGTALGAIGFGAMVKGAIDSADALDNLSMRTGISVESLSTLGYAAEMSDASLDSLATGVKGLSTVMNEAAAGNKTAQETLRGLNVEYKNTDGTLRSTEDVLFDIADQFANTEDGALKTATAVKVFGKSGMDLIPMLNEGSAGLRRLQGDARAMGLEISGDTAAAAAKFNDDLDKLKKTADGLVISLATDMLPGLTEITTAMTEAAKEGGPLLALWVGLGGALSQLVNGNEMQQAADQIRDLNAQLNDLVFRQREMDKGTALGVIAGWLYGDEMDVNAQIDETNAKLEAARQTLERLRNPPQQTAPGGAKGTGLTVPGGGDDKTDASRQKSIDALIKGLEKEAATYGMTAEAIKLYELRQLGASEADLTRAASLSANIEESREFEEAVRASEEAVKKENEENHKWLVSLDEAAQKIREAVNPMEALEEELKELDLLLEMGKISWDEYAEATAAAWEKTADKTKESTDEMTEFAREAARNMQDAMADGFFSIMQGEFDNLADTFKQTIDRMVANLLASQLMGFLTGDFGKTGQLGGVVGDLFKGLPGFATGGDFVVGGAGGIDSQLVAFRASPGERVSVDTPGSGTRKSGDAYNITVNMNDSGGGQSRQSASQTGQDIGRAIQRALQRNG